MAVFVSDPDIVYETAATCYELYTMGVRSHGYYKLLDGIRFCYMAGNLLLLLLLLVVVVVVVVVVVYTTATTSCWTAFASVTWPVTSCCCCCCCWWWWWWWWWCIPRLLQVAGRHSLLLHGR